MMESPGSRRSGRLLVLSLMTWRFGCKGFKLNWAYCINSTCQKIPAMLCGIAQLEMTWMDTILHAEVWIRVSSTLTDHNALASAQDLRILGNGVWILSTMTEIGVPRKLFAPYVKYTDFTASWSIQIASLRSWYLYLRKELISATDDISFSTAHANSQHHDIYNFACISNTFSITRPFCKA